MGPSQAVLLQRSLLVFLFRPSHLYAGISSLTANPFFNVALRLFTPRLGRLVVVECHDKIVACALSESSREPPVNSSPFEEVESTKAICTLVTTVVFACISLGPGRDGSHLQYIRYLLYYMFMP